MNDDQPTPAGERPSAPHEESTARPDQGAMSHQPHDFGSGHAESTSEESSVAVASRADEPFDGPAPQAAETPVEDLEPKPVEPQPFQMEPHATVEPEPFQMAPPAAPEPSGRTDEQLFDDAMSGVEDGRRDSSVRKLAKGDRVEATVIQVERDRVFVDLGTKSEGVVPLSELTELQLETAEGHVQVGDKIQVVVLRPEGAEGAPIVSKKRADFEETWNNIIESHADGKTFTAQVVDRVKGGLVVDIGVRGFVPATHVGNGKLRNIEKYVGQPITLKIIEIDRERKKVVLSNRLAEEERRSQVKDEMFTKVAPGDILDGTVRRLTDYGAFVDLGGIDGLLHISEMSWMRINHPREVLKEGQKLKVMVLRLDPQNSKISLGLRQVLPDPWNLIRQNYRIGQKINVIISRLVQSGAFVKLPEGAEAFLPVSEISNRRIGKPSDVLTEGQEAELTVIDLRPDERRMVLSLRGGSMPDAQPHGGGGYERGGGGDFDDDRGGKKGKRGGGGQRKGGGGAGGGGGGRRGGRVDDDEFEGGIVGRVPTGGATIGERLGMLKGFLGREDEDAETEHEHDLNADAPGNLEEPAAEQASAGGEPEFAGDVTPQVAGGGEPEVSGDPEPEVSGDPDDQTS